MSTRSFRWRGFGLTIRVPERIGRAFRRLRPRASQYQGSLVVRPSPSVTIRTRDPDRAVAFITNHFENTPRQGEPRADSSARKVSAQTWYHTIELPNGAVTPGLYDHRMLVPHYGLPEDLHGQRALDIGTFDGFWAFELERRGADVTALDIENVKDLDLPPAAATTLDDRGVWFPLSRGSELAREQLGSRVAMLRGNVYNLDADHTGRFDFVHAGDILLHLRDPALALQRIRAVTAGMALLSDAFDPDLDALGAGPGLIRYLGGWDDATWWAPALSTLVQMVADAGFSRVEVVTTYNLAARGTSGGPWRAVLRAHA